MADIPPNRSAKSIPLTLAAAHSEGVFRTYLHVTHLLQPPYTLFNPAVLARVLAGMT